MWAAWWIWASFALVLAIGEVLLPGYVLLGFAMGAGAVALALVFGGPGLLWLTGSLPAILVLFALTSLAAWLILRRMLGVRQGQVRRIDHDINDN